MLVELSVMEQRYQAVLAAVQDGEKIAEIAARVDDVVGLADVDADHDLPVPTSCSNSGGNLSRAPLGFTYRGIPSKSSHTLVPSALASL